MLRQAIPVLHVTSVAAAQAFYCGMLGFDVGFCMNASDIHRDPCYMSVSRDGAEVHLSSYAGDGIAGGVVLLRCDDVDSLNTEFVAKGVVIHTGPVDQTWGTRELYVRDPDGNSVRFAAPLA